MSRWLLVKMIDQSPSVRSRMMKLGFGDDKWNHMFHGKVDGSSGLNDGRDNRFIGVRERVEENHSFEILRKGETGYGHFMEGVDQVINLARNVFTLVNTKVDTFNKSMILSSSTCRSKKPLKLLPEVSSHRRVSHISDWNISFFLIMLKVSMDEDGDHRLGLLIMTDPSCLSSSVRLSCMSRSSVYNGPPSCHGKQGTNLTRPLGIIGDASKNGSARLNRGVDVERHSFRI